MIKTLTHLHNFEIFIIKNNKCINSKVLDLQDFMFF